MHGGNAISPPTVEKPPVYAEGRRESCRGLVRHAVELHRLAGEHQVPCCVLMGIARDDDDYDDNDVDVVVVVVVVVGGVEVVVLLVVVLVVLMVVVVVVVLFSSPANSHMPT